MWKLIKWVFGWIGAGRSKGQDTRIIDNTAKTWDDVKLVLYQSVSARAHFVKWPQDEDVCWCGSVQRYVKYKKNKIINPDWKPNESERTSVGWNLL